MEVILDFNDGKVWASDSDTFTFVCACPLSYDLISLGWNLGWFPFLFIAKLLNGKYYKKFHYTHTQEIYNQEHNQLTN